MSMYVLYLLDRQEIIYIFWESKDTLGPTAALVLHSFKKMFVWQDKMGLFLLWTSMKKMVNECRVILQ